MSWLDSNFTYRSGPTPKYKVRDIVYKILVVTPTWKKKLQKFCVDCEVTGVSAKKSGFIFKEFTYTVKMVKAGTVIENVYESELYPEYQSVPETKNPDVTAEDIAEMLYEESL